MVLYTVHRIRILRMTSFEHSYVKDERLENEERGATGGLWMTHTGGLGLLVCFLACSIN